MHYYKDPGRFLLIYHQQLLKDQEKYAHIHMYQLPGKDIKQTFHKIIEMYQSTISWKVIRMHYCHIYTC